MAMDHFGRAPSAPVFILKLILSINLYFSLFTSVNRIALLSLEISVASIFLANCLDSLKEKIQRYIRSKWFAVENSLPRKVKELKNQEQFKSSLDDYNFIIVLQRNINHHFSKTLYFTIFILMFTVIFPALILFQQKDKIVLKIFFAINYVMILFGCLFPIVVCNARFLNSVSIFFVCFSID